MSDVAQKTMITSYDIDRIRADFPILSREVHGKPMAFLDSAASAQKPRQVIDAVSTVYETEYANVHRGAYQLSERATNAYEGARVSWIVAEFLGIDFVPLCHTYSKHGDWH